MYVYMINIYDTIRWQEHVSNILFKELGSLLLERVLQLTILQAMHLYLLLVPFHIVPLGYNIPGGPVPTYLPSLELYVHKCTYWC